MAKDRVLLVEFRRTRERGLAPRGRLVPCCTVYEGAEQSPLARSANEPIGQKVRFSGHIWIRFPPGRIVSSHYMAFTAPPEAATLGVMHFRLSDWVGDDGLLAGRAQGEAARSALQAELLAHRSGAEPVGIDARGIKAMSFPFADSFFGPLLSGWLAGYYDEHPIVVFGANEDVAETVDAALRLRNMGVISVSDETRLLGGEPALRETIAVAARLGRFSATQLGVELGVTPQAANNRLKALVRMGALVRVPIVVPGGGREFVYRVSEATPTEA
jgi:hypothetical protein